jgi:hypothetical protein
MYVKVTNGVATEYTMGHLRRDNPNTSFPRTCSDELLASYDVYPFQQDPKPDYDPLTQNLIPDFEEVDGVWYKTYTAVNKSQEEAEENIRNQRSILLSETDWMALSDVTLSAEWATYRQALRDITSQDGFPYSVTWPTKPS